MPNLRIGYYYAAAAQGLQGGGIGPYTQRTLELLLDSDIAADFHLLITKDQVGLIEGLRLRFPHRRITSSILHMSSQANFLHRSFDYLRTRSRKKWMPSVSHATNYLEWQIASHKLDVLHSPIQTLPLYSWRTPTIITVHDVQELHFPENFTPQARHARALGFWLGFEYATKIVVSYSHVKHDIVNYFKVPSDKIFVCPHAADRRWLSQPDAESALHIRKLYNLPTSFMLYPAQTWPHKNHIGLLHAMAYMRDELGITPPHLVCTGHVNEFYPVVESKIQQLGLQDHVRFLKTVPAEHLVALYQSCGFVIIPSKYEAGSYPLMEALILGVPVLCSRVTSLPETMANPSYTFETTPSEMANLIRRMLSEPSFSEQCKQHSVRRGQELLKDTAQTASAFSALYHSLKS